MRKDVQFNFRLPAELKAAIEEAAAANKRSLSAEVGNRLIQSLAQREDTSTPQELGGLLLRTQRALAESQEMNMRLISALAAKVEDG